MRRSTYVLVILALSCLGRWGSGGVLAQEATKPMPPSTAAPVAIAPVRGPILLHDVHAKQGFECDICHVPVKEGSVVLSRPGHDSCKSCHGREFKYKIGVPPNLKFCSQCHSSTMPVNSTDVLPFPKLKDQHEILVEFSHKHHVDPMVRLVPKTMERADCAFCHKASASGGNPTFPGHAQCSSCHSKPGIQPMLSATSTAADCHGCHNPEQMENPGLAKSASHTLPRMVAAHVAAPIDAKSYANIKFSHSDHFQMRDRFPMSCSTCHSEVTAANSLAETPLPNKIDCVGCHETSKALAPEFRMTNCSLCHIDHQSGPIPTSHSRDVKPASHDEAFRQHHSEQAGAADAKCFLCHTAISPKTAPNLQCLACHQVMRPASHTARWADDVHGKYAAIDRTSCATCHANDFCSRCHNELPRSHVPLPSFKNGGHARLAMVNKRSCLTCHTFQNTCAECHLNK